MFNKIFVHLFQTYEIFNVININHKHTQKRFIY